MGGEGEVGGVVLGALCFHVISTETALSGVKWRDLFLKRAPVDLKGFLDYARNDKDKKFQTMKPVDVDNLLNEIYLDPLMSMLAMLAVSS